MLETDVMLIARVVRHDDRAAFGELVRRHQPLVRGFLRRMLGGTSAQDLADDLAQETFIKAYRGLREFRSESALTSWLCAIAANELRAEWRRRRRRAEFLDEECDATVENGGASAHEVSSLLARLSEAQRAALVLCFEHGLSHEEAAAALGCPLGTLKSHVSRGKARLKTWLEEKGA